MELIRGNKVFALKFFICLLITSKKDMIRRKSLYEFIYVLILLQSIINFNVAVILKMCGTFLLWNSFGNIHLNLKRLPFI